MQHTYTAFLDGHRLTTGPLHEVARGRAAGPAGAPGRASASSAMSAASLSIWTCAAARKPSRRATPWLPGQAPKGRGRPKLGVVAREVTLLPEHWDWLAAQPGGASVALRKPCTKRGAAAATRTGPAGAMTARITRCRRSPTAASPVSRKHRGRCSPATTSGWGADGDMARKTSQAYVQQLAEAAPG